MLTATFLIFISRLEQKEGMRQPQQQRIHEFSEHADSKIK